MTRLEMSPAALLAAGRDERLADIAYRRLEVMFVLGVLPPGRFVSEAGLMERLALGRMPVREAIKRFEAERLLVPVHRKGIYVPAIDLGEYFQLLEVRRSIETLLVRAAASRATAAEREALARCLPPFETATLDDDALMANDYAYKAILLAAARNQFLEWMIRPLHTLGRRFWYFHGARDSTQQTQSNRMQAAIVRAVCAGTAADAAESLGRYLDFFERLARAVGADEI